MKSFLRLIIFTSTLWLVFPVLAAEPEELGPDKWPTTVQGAVKDILSRMSEKDKELVRKTKHGDLIMFHHGWGTGIRNYYGLWRGNKKLIKSACGRPCQPDDASMVIIGAVWQELQSKSMKRCVATDKKSRMDVLRCLQGIENEQCIGEVSAAGQGRVFQQSESRSSKAGQSLSYAKFLMVF
ncbi:MAG: hypothetical protein PSU93_07235 [Methylobacter sp.]|uniref:DUF6794 domain-containing protein n=1 Tax=Candidatus Methylobacter titanis TaxID=3053457 RepID=A0AA43Q5G4_9GAMM|nr:hypothetical protein [Candidatus Methylobacter titanis]